VTTFAIEPGPLTTLEDSYARLDRLRFAKDKQEFDQFMSERRNRQTPEASAPQS